VDRPLHEQIADDFRRRIASGELPVGTRLPSEARLGEQWNGSRAPIRQALAALRAEGLIGGGRGKPPVVRRQTLSQPFDTFLSFSKWAADVGHTPGQRTAEIARRPAPAEIADVLGLDVGEPVVQLVRLRLLDGQPVMIERTSFVERYGRLLFDYDCDSGSIYAYLISRGLQVGIARHVIDAVGADDTHAGLLGLAVGAPLLRERRLACTISGAPFEYSEDSYRPDIVSFAIDNQPHSQPTLVRAWNPSDDLLHALGR
jgi:GntR family transcriptional regulator